MYTHAHSYSFGAMTHIQNTILMYSHSLTYSRTRTPHHTPHHTTPHRHTPHHTPHQTTPQTTPHTTTHCTTPHPRSPEISSLPSMAAQLQLPPSALPESAHHPGGGLPHPPRGALTAYDCLTFKQLRRQEGDSGVCVCVCVCVCVRVDLAA